MADIARLLRRLQTDNTSGAMALLERAIDILEAFANQPASGGHAAFQPAIEALTRSLIDAQPSMAPMINLAQQVLQACAKTCQPALAREQLRQALRACRQRMRRSTAALCKQALTQFPPRATILTYSNSGTVIAALRHAHDHGRVARVILSESRPTLDGRPQALALLQHSIEVEYGIDMALFAQLPNVQLVVVGADAVFPHGVVNKLGTHALAQIAGLCHIPIFSLCTSSKFLPAAAAPLLRTVDHPGEEVWPDAPADLHIRNRYFDTTPLTLFNGIISETGIYAPADLRAHLQHQELCPALQKLASERAAGNHHRTFTPNGASLECFDQG